MDTERQPVMDSTLQALMDLGGLFSQLKAARPDKPPEVLEPYTIVLNGAWRTCCTLTGPEAEQLSQVKGMRLERQ